VPRAGDPPYRIRTERLVLRCWDPHDAPRLKEAVDSSLDHLRPWMPWAVHEPQPLEQKVRLLRQFRSDFDRGEDFVYGIFDAREAEVVGGSGLHTRVGPEAFEIGYWIRADRIGEGLATETAAALTRVALDVCGAERIEIRVDPSNTRSAAIPRKLGFREEATLRRRLPAFDGEGLRDVTIFSLFREELHGTPVPGVTVEAYDAAGARVL
jgi:RimJ/RimL family protein N-acetyltransferase